MLIKYVVVIWLIHVKALILGILVLRMIGSDVTRSLPFIVRYFRKCINSLLDLVVMWAIWRGELIIMGPLLFAAYFAIITHHHDWALRSERELLLLQLLVLLFPVRCCWNSVHLTTWIQRRTLRDNIMVWWRCSSAWAILCLKLRILSILKTIALLLISQRLKLRMIYRSSFLWKIWRWKVWRIYWLCFSCEDIELLLPESNFFPMRLSRRLWWHACKLFFLYFKLKDDEDRETFKNFGNWIYIKIKVLGQNL